MRIFFRVVSIAYVSAIFLFADSSVARDLARFNPYSLLHIPVYGVMSLLLFFSIAPVKSMALREAGFSGRTARMNLKPYFFMVGLIALGVAVTDEYRQSFMPGRTASLGDVLLDLTGIFIFLFLFSRFIKSNRRHA